MTLDVLDGMYGELITNHIIMRTMRFMGIQFAPEIQKLAGIEGSSASAVADLFARLLCAQGQDFSLEKVDAKTMRLIVRSFRPLGDVSEDRRRSLFEFQKMVARVINGHLRVERHRGQNGSEAWEITDTGMWQW